MKTFLSHTDIFPLFSIQTSFLSLSYAGILPLSFSQKLSSFSFNHTSILPLSTSFVSFSRTEILPVFFLHRYPFSLFRHPSSVFLIIRALFFSHLHNPFLYHTDIFPLRAQRSCLFISYTYNSSFINTDVFLYKISTLPLSFSQTPCNYFPL
jgi:hypothetical protein